MGEHHTLPCVCGDAASASTFQMFRSTRKIMQPQIPATLPALFSPAWSASNAELHLFLPIFIGSKLYRRQTGSAWGAALPFMAQLLMRWRKQILCRCYRKYICPDKSVFTDPFLILRKSSYPAPCRFLLHCCGAYPHT